MTDRHERGHHGPDADALDRQLREALAGAVADVTPHDRLAEIRRRTRRTTRPSRRWAPVVLGAGVATAVVVAGSLAVGRLGDPAGEPEPAASRTPTSTPEPTHRATALYFLADTVSGPRLHREFQSLPAEDDAADTITDALARLDPTEGPDDPDYYTNWPSGSFGGAEVDVDRIRVHLADDAALARPAGMSARDALLGIQQVVYTAEAGLGDPLPVEFVWEDRPARRVLGFRLDGPVLRNTQYDVTAPVNISDPAEGLEVSGTFVATGTQSEQAQGVTWTLTGPGATLRRVARGSTHAVDEAGEDEVAPLEVLAWQTDPIDVAELTPGDYELVVRTEVQGNDSSGVTEFYTDTRTIVVR